MVWQNGGILNISRRIFNERMDLLIEYVLAYPGLIKHRHGDFEITIADRESRDEILGIGENSYTGASLELSSFVCIPHS
jgi:hypothetical protein